MSIKERDTRPCKTTKADALYGTIIGGGLVILALLYVILVIRF